MAKKVDAGRFARVRWGTTPPEFKPLRVSTYPLCGETPQRPRKQRVPCRTVYTGNRSPEGSQRAGGDRICCPKRQRLQL